MPSFLSWFEIDWRWPELTHGEREIVRRYHQDFLRDPGSESYTTLRERLVAASHELPGRTIRARCVDGDDEDETQLEFSVRDGVIGDGTDDFDPEGMLEEPRELRADRHDKVCQPLYFTEDVLEEIQRLATRQDKSLSWMVQKAWVLARQEIRKAPAYRAGELPPEE